MHDALNRYASDELFSGSVEHARNSGIERIPLTLLRNCVFLLTLRAIG